MMCCRRIDNEERDENAIKFCIMFHKDYQRKHFSVVTYRKDHELCGRASGLNGVVAGAEWKAAGAAPGCSQWWRAVPAGAPAARRQTAAPCSAARAPRAASRRPARPWPPAASACPLAARGSLSPRTFTTHHSLLSLHTILPLLRWNARNLFNLLNILHFT